MRKKLLKYTIVVVVIALLAYKSVYIEKLSDVKAARSGSFDAAGFAWKLWKEQLPVRIREAVELPALLASLRANAEETFSRHGHSIGITNTASFLVRASGVVTTIGEDEVVILTGSGDSSLSVTIATEYVYGNTIRDASGLVDIRDFTNTMDLNTISEELNRIVRTTVLPSFKAKAQKGSRVEWTGALELNREHLNLEKIEIIPVELKMIP
ncbi:MAG: DUF2291 domain-containing protein [Chitinophagaceae bacterium]